MPAHIKRVRAQSVLPPLPGIIYPVLIFGRRQVVGADGRSRRRIAPDDLNNGRRYPLRRRLTYVGCHNAQEGNVEGSAEASV